LTRNTNSKSLSIRSYSIEKKKKKIFLLRHSFLLTSLNIW